MSQFVIRVKQGGKIKHSITFSIEQLTEDAFQHAKRINGLEDDIVAEALLNKLSGVVPLTIEHTNQIKTAARELVKIPPRISELTIHLDGDLASAPVSIPVMPPTQPGEKKFEDEMRQAQPFNPQSQDTFRNLQAEISRLNEQNRILRQKIAELLDTADMPTRTLKEEQERSAKMREDLRKAQEDVNRLRKQYADATEQIARLKAQHTEWEKEHVERQQLQAENEQLKDQIRKLTQGQEVAGITEDIEKLRQDTAQLIMEYGNLVKRWQAALAKHAQPLDKSKIVAAQLTEFKQKRQAWEQEAKEIEKGSQEAQRILDEIRGLGDSPRRGELPSAVLRIQGRLSQLQDRLSHSERELRECESYQLRHVLEKRAKGWLEIMKKSEDKKE